MTSEYEKALLFGLIGIIVFLFSMPLAAISFVEFGFIGLYTIGLILPIFGGVLMVYAVHYDVKRMVKK